METNRKSFPQDAATGFIINQPFDGKVSATENIAK